MKTAERIVREHQLRVLLAGGERGPVLQRLFGVSPRTIKRLVRKSAPPVHRGRTPGPARGWLGRERRVVEQVLQHWLSEGLEKLLAGEAPSWLQEMAHQVGMRGADTIAAMLQRITVQEQETPVPSRTQALARVVVCSACHTPLVVVRREGVRRIVVPQCPTPGCRLSRDSSTRVQRLDDWRHRRAQGE